MIQQLVVEQNVYRTKNGSLIRSWVEKHNLCNEDNTLNGSKVKKQNVQDRLNGNSEKSVGQLCKQ